MTLKVQQRRVSDLIPYTRNARMHSDAQVAQIAASIKEFGWTNPILVDGDGGIIAGHGRLLAARRLSMDKVPCIVIDHLSEIQRKALIIADNKMALNAGWDEEMLGLEIKDLENEDFDLSLTGFDEEEIEALLVEKERLAEKTENMKPITYTRILVSIPTDSAPGGLDEFLKAVTLAGGHVDYGGN